MGVSREQLKAVGNPRRARAGAKAGPEPVKETKVSDALGALPASLELGGRKFELGALNLNDLIRIEKAYESLEGFLEKLAGMGTEDVRFFLWLFLRKSDVTLTAEDAGEILPADPEALATLIDGAIAASGLMEKGGQSDDPPAPAGEPTGSS